MVVKLQNMSSNRNGFTLVEMMAVLVIMGILIAFAVPAVERIMKSSGLSIADRGVSNSLSLARQYAITHRTSTRVIFAYYDPVTPANTAGSTNMWYVAYTVVARENNTAATWDYVSKWDYLPAGAIFLNDNPGNTVVATPTAGPFPAGSSLNSDLQSFTLPFPTASSPATRFAFIEFNSTGADSRSDGRTDQLTLTEGFIQNSSLPFRTSSNYVNIAVDNIVGRIQETRP